jgi:hypothetical protein
MDFLGCEERKGGLDTVHRWVALTMGGVVGRDLRIPPDHLPCLCDGPSCPDKVGTRIRQRRTSVPPTMLPISDASADRGDAVAIPGIMECGASAPL